MCCVRPRALRHFSYLDHAAPAHDKDAQRICVLHGRRPGHGAVAGQPVSRGREHALQLRQRRRGHRHRAQPVVAARERPTRRRQQLPQGVVVRPRAQHNGALHAGARVGRADGAFHARRAILGAADARRVPTRVAPPMRGALARRARAQRHLYKGTLLHRALFYACGHAERPRGYSYLDSLSLSLSLLSLIIPFIFSRSSPDCRAHTWREASVGTGRASGTLFPWA